MIDLARAEAVLAPLEREAYETGWEMAAAATDETAQAATVASVAYETALADPVVFAGAAAAADDPSLPPAERRRAESLRLMCGPKQRPADLIEPIIGLEMRLQNTFSSFRATVGGVQVSDNEIDRILLDEPDVALRREAWEASKEVGAVIDSDLRQVVRLRNDAARRLGYRDHYAMALALDELDETWLYDLLGTLETDLAEPWRAEKAAIDRDVRERLGLATTAPLAPWHYADRFFQDPPSPAVDPLLAAAASIDVLGACRRYFADLGHDVDEILARSDLYPREGKNQHAFQLTVDRSRDIRILCNITPSLRWLGTTLHELGHAIYDQSIDPGLPWLLRTVSHTFTTEAIAMLHGRGARDASFLSGYAAVDPDVAANPLNAAIGRRDRLVLMRWVLVMAHFERALYADPDQDLATLWWDLAERFQGISRPPGDRPHDWATKIHLAGAPVYYHNYLLGEVCASQLAELLERETGSASPADHPAASGAIIRDRFLAPGRSLRWDDLIERATGAPLGPEAFVRDATGRVDDTFVT